MKVIPEQAGPKKISTTPDFRGQSSHLGATIGPGGVNFSVSSRDAIAVDLLLFDREDDAQPVRVIPIDPNIFTLSQTAPHKGHNGTHDTGSSTARNRFECFVRSRSQSNALSESISSVLRQRQLPSARPGTFIRASLPRFSKSCNGAIESAATDDQAICIKARAGSFLSALNRFTYFRTFCRWSSDNSSNQLRVVGLSCVPVYTTAFGT